MTILSDRKIKALCAATNPMIHPFVPGQVRLGDRLPVTARRYRDLVDKPGELVEGVHFGCVGNNPDMCWMAKRIVSYGLSSYGYDFRVAPEFKIFTNVHSALIDPLEIDEQAFVHKEGPCCIVPPNSFVLTRTLEYFRMPKNVTGLVTSKSTYARSGLHCLTTVIEPGWEGELVLEYANMTPLPIRLHAEMGGGQILFYEGDECDVPYDRSRKYFGQRGITLPRV